MESHASVFGHPLHPVLIVFPASLFPLMLLLDVVHYFEPSAGVWTAIFWLAVAGVVTSVAAAIPGIIDMAKVPDNTQAHKTGMWHAIIGTSIIVLYGLAVWLRWPGVFGENYLWASALDLAGVLAVSVQGYLGGTLVYKHHLGVVTAAEGGEPTAWEGEEGAAVQRGPVKRGQLRP